MTNSEDRTWELLHDYYGPCDAFGPNGACSQCSGMIERVDGSVVNAWSSELVSKPTLWMRIPRAFSSFWQELTYSFKERNL